jgi:photosystem II stability/assembly factor-like uncharacterized protein/Leucine-rich repeat (LRR) protein
MLHHGGASPPPCTNLTAPLNGVTDIDENDVTISWSPVSEADGYKLIVGTSPTNTSILNYADAGNNTSYNLGRLSFEATIYVRILPYNAGGYAAGCIQESFTIVSCENSVQYDQVWLGGDGLWNDPLMWNTGRFPDCNDNIVLTNGVVTYPLGFTPFGDLKISETGSMEVQAGATLQGLVMRLNNYGSITNEGIVSFSAPSEHSIQNYGAFVNQPGGNINMSSQGLINAGVGTFENFGDLNILNVSDNGIINSGNLINPSGGKILVDHAAGTGISGGFENHGEIAVRNITNGDYALSTGILADGFVNSGSIIIDGVDHTVVQYAAGIIGPFNNQPGGTIQIQNTGIGINNVSDYISNSGIITISQSIATGMVNQNRIDNQTNGEISTDGLSNSGSFLNDTGSAIFIHPGSESFGFKNNTVSGSFTNNGSIQLDGTSLSNSTYGSFYNIGSLTIDNGYLENSEAFFSNGENASLSIQNTSLDAISNFSPTPNASTFVNYGAIDIQNNIGRFGINNNGQFNNEAGAIVNLSDAVSNGIENAEDAHFNNRGTVNIGNTGENGIQNWYGANFTNSGNISLNQIGNTGISSYGQFYNNPGAQITTQGISIFGIQVATGNFDNKGNITFGNNPGIRALAVQTGTFINQSAGFIQGNGIIAGANFSNRGTLDPGYSPGKIHFYSSYDHSLGAYRAELEGLAGAGVAGGNDVLEFNYATTLGGTLNVSLLNNFDPAPGDIFTILTCNNGCTGTFDNINFPSDPSLWQVHYNGDNVEIERVQLGCTSLISPIDGMVVVPPNVTLSWAPAPGNPQGYILQVGTTPGGSDILNMEDVGNVTSYALPELTLNTTIYVTITPYNNLGNAIGCQEESFTTLSPSSCLWDAQNSTTTNSLFDVFFTDANTGYAVGLYETILKTIDGGNTWNNLYETANFGSWNSVFFVDSNTGWIGRTNGTIWKTIDGGASWTPQSSSTSGSIASMYFISAEVGWFITTDGWVFNTTDGGDAWNLQHYSSYYLRAIHFVNASTGWISGWNGHLLKTVDGGNTWTASSNGTEDQSDIFFIDETTGWVLYGNNILKSMDGGSSWVEQYAGDNKLADLKFVDALTGWAISFSGDILHTKDGGATWLLQSNSVTASLQAIDVIRSEEGVVGWIVGLDGAILHMDCVTPTTPVCTNLINPVHDAVDVSVNTELSWYPVPNALGYLISLGTSPGGVDILNQVNITDGTSYQASALPHNAIIYVNITPYNEVGQAINCQEESFTTEAETILGCTNSMAHNYNPNATQDDGSCETCSDQIQNGDETGVDCGGARCQVCPPGCTQLITPQNNATDVSVDVELFWQTIPEATGYKLLVGTSSGSGDILNNLDVGNVASYSPGSLPYNSTIYVTVIPYNAGGEAGGCTEESFTIPVLPTCTSLTSPVNGASGVASDADLFWMSIPEATGYRLTVGTTPGGGEILSNLDVGNVSTIDAGTLPDNSLIYVKVVPYNDSGDALDCEEESFSVGCTGNPVTVTWIGGSGNWNVASNWDMGFVPSICDRVLISDGSTTIPGDFHAHAKSVRIENGAILTVDAGSTLTINNTDYYSGIDLDYAGVVNNSGTIDIDNVTSYPLGSTTAGITNFEGFFNNLSGGEIIIGATTDYGIINSSGSQFSNHGLIDITSGFNRSGIQASNAFGSFVNESDGLILIDKINGNGMNISLSFGEFYNYGEISFGSEITGNCIAGSRGLFDNQPSGLIKGTGVIDGEYLSNQGTISPGFSPGDFNIITTYDHSSGTFDVEVAGNAGPAVAEGHDQLTLSGVVTLGGTLNISLINGFFPNTGDSYVILSLPDGYTGSFNTINWPDGQDDWQVIYLSNSVVISKGNFLPCSNLVTPLDGAIDVSIDATLEWTEVNNATGYYLAVGATSGGTDILAKTDVGNTTSYSPGALPYNTTIYVTITPYNANGEAQNCTEETFSTQSAPITGCTDPQAHNYDPQATVDDGSCETCTDGIQNGDETGIDCGGSLCGPCGATCPDLIVSDLIINSISGNTVNYTVTIKNIGTETIIFEEISPSVILQATASVDDQIGRNVAGAGGWTISTGTLPAGAELSYTRDPLINLTVYNYLILKIDDGNRFEECDETNNEKAVLLCGDPIPVYVDADGDGFGNPEQMLYVCNQPPGYVTNNTDCDDSRNDIYPDAPEFCDGVDNDCNGQVDETAECGCVRSDSLALVALYNATDGPNWTNTWDLNQPMDTWHGVLLNANGCVEGLDLPNNQLSGQIPPEIGMLSEIQFLILDQNGLTGNLPEEIGNLTNMLVILLTSNQLVGSLPASLGDLSNLLELYLGHNLFSGSIPPQLGNLSQLEEFHLNDNQLTGELPSALSGMTTVRGLELQNNQLSGCFPAEYSIFCTISYDFTGNPALPWQGDFSRFCNEEPQIGAACNDGNPETINDAIQADCGCSGIIINPCRMQDSLALVDFYHVMGGPNWDSIWELSDPIDTWHGVTLNPDGCVEKLQMNNVPGGCTGCISAPGNNLSGTIPSDLQLPNLTLLDLSGNVLEGEIPDFTGLPQLETLGLAGCQLEGGLPDFNNLPLLRLYLVAGNRLTGEIPDFQKLPELHFLAVNKNKLEGNLPNFSLCPNLNLINVGENQLEGEIPDYGASQSNLSLLDVFSNRFTFENLLPHFSSNKDSIESNSIRTYRYAPQDSIFTDTIIIRMEGQPLTIDLAIDDTVSTNQYAWFKNGVPLQTISGDNVLYFPELEMADAGNYWVKVTNPLAPELTLNGRNITLIVEENCRLRDSSVLVALYYATNGPNWTTSWDLNQPIETWHGVYLNGDGCVIALDLSNNQLSGNLPAALGDLSNLEKIYFSGNSLTGAIPAELGALSSLKQLDLSFNQLSGSIPAELGNLTSLVRMDLSDNQLTGDIPPALSELPNLTWLDLSNNPLSENILTQLSSLPNLTELYLRDMQLSGEIPAELANLTNLVSLDLSNNQFTGGIPPELGNLTNLVVLNLANNQLSGEIPPELGDIVNLASPNRYYQQFDGDLPADISILKDQISAEELYRQLGGSISFELAYLSNLTLIDLSNNQLSGCFPASLQVYCNITYDFSNNLQLPWQGDFSRFCNEETQIGAACDDGDPATINDQITTDCGCQGVPAGLRITPKVYLQGPYNPTTGFMNDHLRDNNLLPQTEPYDALGYTLVGSGGETAEPSVFETTGPDAIVDWVFLELRDKSDPTMVLATRSALLQADGDVVDTDGVAPVNFADLPPDDYYLVVKHRNHLGVMTAAPVALSATPTSIDFTTDLNQVAGGANGIAALPGGKLGLYSGDFNGNGQVQNTDYAAMVLTLGTAGYLPGDFDLNGQVQNTDLQLRLVPNIGRGAAFD